MQMSSRCLPCKKNCTKHFKTNPKHGSIAPAWKFPTGMKWQNGVRSFCPVCLQNTWHRMPPCFILPSSIIAMKTAFITALRNWQQEIWYGIKCWPDTQSCLRSMIPKDNGRCRCRRIFGNSIPIPISSMCEMACTMCWTKPYRNTPQSICLQYSWMWDICPMQSVPDFCSFCMNPWRRIRWRWFRRCWATFSFRSIMPRSALSLWEKAVPENRCCCGYWMNCC